MNKLTPDQVTEYFDDHIHYRLGILLAHYRMTRVKWEGDPAVLNACFVASLVTARLFINMLGIGKAGAALAPFQPYATDLTVDDFGGVLIDPATLPQAEQDMIFNFLKMADQAAAHFTTPILHDWSKTHDVVLLVMKYLKSNLYDPAGRASPSV